MKEEEILKLHFLENQKWFQGGQEYPLDFMESIYPVGWINIDGIVHAVYPATDYSYPFNLNGLLLPIKNTEEQMKSDYKRLFGIIIPDDAHQFPLKQEEE